MTQGITAWKPSLKQERFLQIPLTVKEGFYAGAVNAGKTDVLTMYPIVHGWIDHPKFKGLFLRRSMPELRNEVIPRAKDYFRPFGGVFNKTDSCFTFPSGALFFFAHVEHEDDVHNFDSMQPNYVAFDELTSFTEWQYLYITIERVRRNLELKDELPAIVRSGSNPGNTGHAWVFKRFIKPFPKGGQILKGRGGLKRIFIPATIDDNPYADPVYKAELDALPEAEKKAKKYGDWSAFEGAVFSEFREKKYPDEPENALHVIPTFDMPKFWPKVCSIDWGFRAMTYVCYGAISPTKRLYIYREQFFIGKKIEEWGPAVSQYINEDSIEDIVICHSAEQHRGEPHTIRELVSDALGKSIELGVKDRLSGKTLLHEYLRWKSNHIPVNEIEPYSEIRAMWLLRNKGQEFYESYLTQYNPPPPEVNLPKLLILNNCVVLIQSIKDCQYAKNKKDDKPAEDVAEFNGDDPYDCLRQLLHKIDNFFDVVTDESRRLEKIAKLEAQLQTSGDMTAYYRNAARVDSEELVLPVRRYSHR